MRRSFVIPMIAVMVIAVLMASVPVSGPAQRMMPEASSPGFGFNQSLYSYSVYIATVTYEYPAYTAGSATGLNFSSSTVSWVSMQPDGALVINPPPYLLYSNKTGNYGTYNVTMNMTGDVNGIPESAVAYAYITVDPLSTNGTPSTSGSPLGIKLTGAEWLTILIGFIAFILTIILMAVTAERKVYRQKEDKYEKEWLKKT